ncbi:MAG: hypothetical protein FJZ96_08135 [Chloroflexi bacterium]|nr:hypothetical protein [Chloroflexota bacterium]
MEISITYEKGRVPVVVLRLAGMLDGSTYEKLNEAVRKIYDGGGRNRMVKKAGHRSTPLTVTAIAAFSSMSNCSTRFRRWRG